MTLHADEFPGWARAPHDATHWAPDTKSYSACWYKKQGGQWYFAKQWCGQRSWIPSPNPPTKWRMGQMTTRSFRAT